MSTSTFLSTTVLANWDHKNMDRRIRASIVNAWRRNRQMQLSMDNARLGRDNKAA